MALWLVIGVVTLLVLLMAAWRIGSRSGAFACLHCGAALPSAPTTTLGPDTLCERCRPLLCDCCGNTVEYGVSYGKTLREVDGEVLCQACRR
jgi:hypothetical protein